MGRYTGPVCRQCRREGQRLFLKGARCHMAKCPIQQGTGAPGMHVARRMKKMSESGSQLRQKQALRRVQEAGFRHLPFFRAAAAEILRPPQQFLFLHLLFSRFSKGWEHDTVFFRHCKQKNRKAEKSVDRFKKL